MDRAALCQVLVQKLKYLLTVPAVRNSVFTESLNGPNLGAGNFTALNLCAFIHNPLEPCPACQPCGIGCTAYFFGTGSFIGFLPVFLFPFQVLFVGDFSDKALIEERGEKQNLPIPLRPADAKAGTLHGVDVFQRWCGTAPQLEHAAPVVHPRAGNAAFPRTVVATVIGYGRGAEADCHRVHAKHLRQRCLVQPAGFPGLVPHGDGREQEKVKRINSFNGLP